MSAQYKQFRFEKYHLDYSSGELVFHYSYDGTRKYTERVKFEIDDSHENVNKKVVDALCFYSFIIAGSSYYKSFLASEIVIVDKELDYWQADFFNMIYRGGLSEFIYTNKLKPDAIASFVGGHESSTTAVDYGGAGVLMMQSGGKDSLLAAELMKQANNEFTAYHMSTTGKYPEVLDALDVPIVVAKRSLDLKAIKEDWEHGAYNGHIPFSALFAGYALIQAALLNKNLVIASNERSADEANVEVDGYTVNHQFTKTFQVEQAIASYIERYVSPDIHYGSILRPLNELQVGQLFAKHGWPKYKDLYSSCNLANYKQGKDDGRLRWDGTCAKCANTFLLLAPFVDKAELLNIFDGKNLLQDPGLLETYRQLLGKSDVKPFECVGTFDELQEAYNLAVEKDPTYLNSELAVSKPIEGLDELGPYQSFFDEFVNYKKILRAVR